MRKLHEIDINSSYHDIRFNFLICQNFIIEGLGWDYQPYAQVAQTLSVGFFTEFSDSDETLSNTITDLIEDGKIIGKLSNNVQQYCKSQFCSMLTTSENPTDREFSIFESVLIIRTYIAFFTALPEVTEATEKPKTSTEVATNNETASTTS